VQEQEAAAAAAEPQARKATEPDPASAPPRVPMGVVVVGGGVIGGGAAAPAAAAAAADAAIAPAPAPAPNLAAAAETARLAAEAAARAEAEAETARLAAVAEAETARLAAEAEQQVREAEQRAAENLASLGPGTIGSGVVGSDKLPLGLSNELAQYKAGTGEGDLDLRHFMERALGGWAAALLAGFERGGVQDGHGELAAGCIEGQLVEAAQRLQVCGAAHAPSPSHTANLYSTCMPVLERSWQSRCLPWGTVSPWCRTRSAQQWVQSRRGR
jgi:hypothetical protein